MQGKTHKAVGFMTGAAIVTYAVSVNSPLMCFGMITAPIGAMLPDIDHHNSKLGRTKDTVFNVIDKICKVVCIVALLVTIAAVFTPARAAICPISAAAFGVSGVIVFVLSDKFSKTFPFLTKHRGIMHTLVLPIILLVLCAMSNNPVTKSLVFGLAAGYLSHLYTDSLTKEGTPLVWPLSQDLVGPKLIKTGGVMEYVVAAIFSVFLIIYALLLAKNSGYLMLILVTLIIPACDVVTKKLSRLLAKSKSKVINPLSFMIVVTLICVVLFLFGKTGAKVISASVLFGTIMGVKHFYSN